MKTYRQKPIVVDLGVTDDVKGQVKVKMFDYLAYLILLGTRTLSNGISYEKTDRDWGTSMHHPKLSVNTLKVKTIPGHQAKGRSNWKI